MNTWWMMEWASKTGIFKSLFCRACTVEIHRQPFHLTFDWIRWYSGKAMDGWMERTMGQTQTGTDKHMIKPAVSAAAQRHWSGGWVKGLAWWWNDGCPMKQKCWWLVEVIKHAFITRKEKASSCFTANILTSRRRIPGHYRGKNRKV